MEHKDIQYWVELVVRRRILILEVAGAFFAVILIGTLLWPPVYESTAAILVQKNRAQLLVSPDLGEDAQQKEAIVAAPVTEEELNSERELVTSNYLVRRALEGLKPAAAPSKAARMFDAFKMTLALPTLGYDKIHGAPAVTPLDQRVQKLMRHLGAAVIKRSDVLEVSFRSHDPKWCAEFLSRLIDQYLEFHGQLSHDPQAEKFFQQQVWLVQQRLRHSEDELRAFQLQSGISNLNEQQQALITRLSELQLSQSKTAADLASAAQQAANLTDQLKRTPERIGKETRSVQNQALQAIKPEVMQLKAERAELLSRYQPTSERIREIDAKLAAAQRILDHENHLEVTERATDLNPLWVTLDTNLAETKARAAALQATADTLAGQIQELHQQLNQMVTNGVQLGRLQRQLATDKQAYLAYVRKAEEARAAGALNSDKILDVSVAQPPREPLQPIFPNIRLNLAAGLVLALGLGLAAAELEERRDPRIYSTYEIAKTSGLKTFAVLHDEA